MRSWKDVQACEMVFCSDPDNLLLIFNSYAMLLQQTGYQCSLH